MEVIRFDKKQNVWVTLFFRRRGWGDMELGRREDLESKTEKIYGFNGISNVQACDERNILE